jgi:hypothetical protein
MVGTLHFDRGQVRNGKLEPSDPQPFWKVGFVKMALKQGASCEPPRASLIGLSLWKGITNWWNCCCKPPENGGIALGWFPPFVDRWHR